MRYSCGLQICDLEYIQSNLEQQLSIEETKKVGGGINFLQAKLKKKGSTALFMRKKANYSTSTTKI